MARNNNLPSRKSDHSPFYENFAEIFDRYARDFFSPMMSEDFGDFSPKVEVKETTKTIEVCAELPGLKEEDINLSLTDDGLIIEGEKRKERKEEDKGYFRSEIEYGSFHRTIPLKAEVDEDNVQASYKNGVLFVTLNKKTGGSERTRKIQVNKSTKH